MSSKNQEFDLSGTEALKAVFRNHASGIAIITALDFDGNPIGFTASSVTSLGSNPPLVSFNIAQGSSSYPFIGKGAKVALHTLDANTLHLAQRLAGDRSQRFDGSETEGPYGVPVFRECPAILIGEVRERFEVESNAVVVIDVLIATADEIPVAPLLYFQRGYHGIGERLADNS